MLPYEHHLKIARVIVEKRQCIAGIVAQSVTRLVQRTVRIGGWGGSDVVLLCLRGERTQQNGHQQEWNHESHIVLRAITLSIAIINYIVCYCIKNVVHA